MNAEQLDAIRARVAGRDKRLQYLQKVNKPEDYARILELSHNSTYDDIRALLAAVDALTAKLATAREALRNIHGAIDGTPSTEAMSAAALRQMED